jgi:hypothetical protein
MTTAGSPARNRDPVMRERERQRERDKECSNFIRILLFVKDLIHNRKSYLLSNKSVIKKS